MLTARVMETMAGIPLTVAEANTPGLPPPLSGVFAAKGS